MCPGLQNTGMLECKDSNSTIGYFCAEGESRPRICPEGKMTLAIS